MAQKLDIAFWSYDRTRLLADGSVKIEGADVAFHSARIVPEIFEAMIRRRAYDVSELGMTYFLRTFDEEGRSPFLAIPVFPVRAFRHGAIYINQRHRKAAEPCRRARPLRTRRRGNTQRHSV